MIVSVAWLCGCPPENARPKIIPGVWAFSFFDLNGAPTIQIPAHIVFMEGGATESEPPDHTLTFTGTATWIQDGESFFMHHIKDGSEIEYMGTVFAPTYMEGLLQQTVGGTVSGLWTATLVAR